MRPNVHLNALGVTLDAVAALKLFGDARVSDATWWIVTPALGTVFGVLLGIVTRGWSYAYLLLSVCVMIGLGIAEIWPFHSEWGWPLPVLIFAVSFTTPAMIATTAMIIFSNRGKRSKD